MGRRPPFPLKRLLVTPSGPTPSAADLASFMARAGVDQPWSDAALEQLIRAATAADRWLADRPEEAPTSSGRSPSRKGTRCRSRATRRRRSSCVRDGVLRVSLGPLARKLSVRFFEPDQPSPFGDSDFVSQQVAGLMADGRRMWRLTVADAAHLIERGRITMALDPSATPGRQAVPIHVARSSRGRRYLRTPGDDEITNNLASLPHPSPLRVGHCDSRLRPADRGA